MEGMDAPARGPGGLEARGALALGEDPATWNELGPRADEGRPARIVCIGGGTGLPVVLRGLARLAAPRGADPGLDLTAIVAMSDDGGSSGKLRRSRGLLPPGDIRNCLVALARGDRELSRVLQFRFGGASGLAGHPVGNLLIAAAAELHGDFLEAVRLLARLLRVRGTVLPSTLEPVQLVAELEDATLVVGERNLARARSRGRVRRVTLQPRQPAPTRGVLEAVRTADLVTIGPGSLFSSVLPNLLVDGVARALQESRALKVLVANLMTQPRETDGMSGIDHVKAVLEHAGPVVDAVLINGSPPPPELVAWYRARGGEPLSFPRRALIDAGVIPVEADLLLAGTRIRHDGRKLARCLVKLARAGL